MECFNFLETLLVHGRPKIHHRVRYFNLLWPTLRIELLHNHMIISSLIVVTWQLPCGLIFGQLAGGLLAFVFDYRPRQHLREASIYYGVQRELVDWGLEAEQLGV